MTSTSELQPQQPRQRRRARTAALVRDGLVLDLRVPQPRAALGLMLGLDEDRHTALIALPRRAPFTVHLRLPDGRELHRRARTVHVSTSRRDGSPTFLRIVMTSMEAPDMCAALAADALSLGVDEGALRRTITDLMGADLATAALATAGQRTRSVPTAVEPTGLVELTGTIRPASQGNAMRSNVSWGIDLRTLAA